MNLEEEVKQGGKAKELLNNPLFEDSFNGIREGLIQQIESCPLKDDDLRNQLMISLQLLKQIKRQLIESIETGELAKFQLNKVE